MGRRLIVTCMRDEGAFLLEWIAHNRAIGFTDFLVFTNDCSDGTEAMLDRLAVLGDVVHERNPPTPGKSIQWQALKRATAHPLLARAEWVLVADVDEFLAIHAGDGTLDALFAAAPGATVHMLPWRMFGWGGRVAFEDAPVTEQFTRAAPDAEVYPTRAAMFKALTRWDGSYARLGVHKPLDPAPGALPVWIDGSGRRMPVGWHGGPGMSPPPPRYRLCQLNHYAVGSAEGFVVKQARGKPNHSSDPIDLGYWVERNFNTVEDRSIARTAARREAERARLMADPALGRLHAAAVAWRRRRFAELIEDPEIFHLFGRLLLCPDTPVLPAPEQRRLLAQLRRFREMRLAERDG